MVARLLMVTALLIGTGLAAARAGSVEAPPPRESLAALPLHVDSWQGRDSPPLADDVVSELGVDDYINRVYAAPGIPPIGVYVGYYLSQRRGDAIHSPRNCLPGAGWQPLSADVIDLPARSNTVRVNRYLIQKGLDRQVVLYWYEGRGRIVANDYMNKLLLMWDAARHNRTSGGLVRVITPIVADERDATERASRFATMLLARLEAYLP